MEIERKFLISGFPEGLPLLGEAVLEQGYLCTDPVVRIRSKESGGRTGYRLCFKGKGKLVRQETELYLTAGQFAELKNLLPAPLVRKEFSILLNRLYKVGVACNLSAVDTLMKIILEKDDLEADKATIQNELARLFVTTPPEYYA